MEPQGKPSLRLRSSLDFPQHLSQLSTLPMGANGWKQPQLLDGPAGMRVKRLGPFISESIQGVVGWSRRPCVVKNNKDGKFCLNLACMNEKASFKRCLCAMPSLGLPRAAIFSKSEAICKCLDKQLQMQRVIILFQP